MVYSDTELDEVTWSDLIPMNAAFLIAAFVLFIFGRLILAANMKTVCYIAAGVLTIAAAMWKDNKGK